MVDEKKWKRMERDLGVAQFERGFGGICPTCRNYNSGDATHCFYCGTPLRRGAAAIAAGRTVAGGARTAGSAIAGSARKAGGATVGLLSGLASWSSNIRENLKSKTLESIALVIVSVVLVSFGFLWAAIGVLFFMIHLYLPNEEEVMAKARQQAGEKAGTEFTSDIRTIRDLTEELKTLKEDLEEADKFLTAVTEKGDMTTAFAVRKEITEMKRKRDDMKKQRTETANKVTKKAREKANQKIIDEVNKIMAEA